MKTNQKSYQIHSPDTNLTAERKKSFKQFLASTEKSVGVGMTFAKKVKIKVVQKETQKALKK